jgi:hypothetical protein
MQNLIRRVDRLERRNESLEEQGIRIVVTVVGRRLALDADSCVAILRDAGYAKSGPFISVVKLARVPENLNARELKTYLQEHGREICSPKDDTTGGQPGSSRTTTSFGRCNRKREGRDRRCS